MIEVYSTDICCHEKANRLIEEIHKTFAGYKANVDLIDCDKILRVVYNTNKFESHHFKTWLKTKGCIAKTLPDN